MADVSVTINPPNSTSVTIGNAVSAHGATHAPGSSDSLESYYYPRTNPSGYATSGDFATTGYVGEVSGYLNSQISFPSNVVFTTGDQIISGAKNFLTRPTVNGVGVLLSGEAPIGDTDSLTGAFYPLNSNPSGYITGVDLSSYVTKSSTGAFVTTGQTGQFITASQTGEFVSTGATGGFVTGSVVRPSETGSFIISSQTGQFISTGSTGVFVTGAVVRPSETGNFITSSQTGSFYPANNPSGFITGVDLSNYVTGSVVRPSETGNFAVNSQVVFITGNQDVSGVKNFYSRPTVNGTGVLLNGEAAGAANTGELTGAFYPLNSNPSGYITGVNLSAYQTVSASTGISGYLQGQISAINLSSGQFLTTGEADSRYVSTTGNIVTGNVVRPSETGLFLTGESDPVFVASTAYGINPTLTGQWGASYSDSITGINVSGSSSKTITLYKRDGSTLTASFSDIEGTGVGTDYFLTGASFNSTNGNLNLYVNNGSVIVQSLDGRYVTGVIVRPNETGSFITSGDLGNYQTISGSTGISGYLQSQISNIDLTPTGAFLTTGAADLRYYSQSNPSGYLTSADILNLATTGYVTGVSGYLQTQISAISNGTGNFITGVNLDSYQTIAGSTGISGYLQGQISSISSSTGLFITGQVVRPTETGSFLTGVDLSPYATIVFTTGISGYQSGLISSLYEATGLYALKSSTGSFLTTGSADLRFYPLSSNPSGYLTASSIADLATTGYVTGVSGHLQSQISILNSFSGQSITGYNRSITGISVGGTTTKTITLFQQNGPALTADFSDLQGTGGGGSSDNSVLLTGDQDISGVKNFYSRLTVNGTGVLLSGEASSSFNGIQWNFISSTSISNNSSVSLQLTGGYSRYMVGFKNVYFSDNGYELRLRCSSDGGSTFFSGSSDYNYGYGILNAYSPTQGSADYAILSPLMTSKPSGGCFGELVFNSLGGASVKPSCKWNISHETWNTANISYYLGAALVNKLTGINAVQFYSSYGNLGGGTLNVYGSNY